MTYIKAKQKNFKNDPDGKGPMTKTHLANPM